MSVSAWELLHTLGRATALAGHGSSLALAQHWNCLRYLTAFQAGHQGRMELSADGKNPRYHRRAVQALDLGIAFGCVAAERILRLRHPDHRFEVVDAELVLEAGWRLRDAGKDVRENTKVRPNYLLVGRKHGEPLRVFSVDCKGSHGRDDAQHVQLANSAANVNTVVLGELDQGGAPVPSLLTSTALLAEGGIEVRVLDPDGDGLLAIPGKPAPDLDGPVDERAFLSLMRFTNPDGTEGSRPGFSLPEQEWEWFSRVLARTTAAALLTFAGDRNAARTLLTKRQQYRLGSSYSHASPGVRCDTGITLGGIRLVGTDHVFRLDGKRVEVFSGIREDMHGLLARHELEEHEARLRGVLASWRRRKAHVDKDWGGPVRMDSSGAVFAIRECTGRQHLA